ncbi:MAG: tRNA guanosine(34) transglycosylase Tgt [Alphaproteobacteria bacterium]|nr:tRNA guanosine(34) transglycosylase Tgt [Alphaproteobacteria bacterium]
MSARLPFAIHATDGPARTGTLTTPRGRIRTPAFMPVGTAGTVKAMLPEQVKASGADILLGNTYHLMLRPGAERIARLGGLHAFMRWEGPILTDSGGYQVMSLAKLRRITEEGVSFRSHIDGAEVALTPERSIEVQRLLGSTIVMVLDECTPFPATHEEARRSMELSLRWAARSKAAFGAPEDAFLFGIVQGSTYADLRAASAAGLLSIGFDGYAVGGLAVGEGQAAMLDTLEVTVPHLPADRPRYLMGVGKPSDIVGAVRRGIDMFDCVIPTRSGRNGQAFTWRGPVNLRNARHAEDPRPLDAASDCPASALYSRAYLHHLVKAGEILASVLLTWHNLSFYQALMARIRASIAQGRLADLEAELLAGEAGGDIPPL